MIRARAWCRVDLAGGTLDIWPLGLLHAGARTVNVAIDLAATVQIERSPDAFYRVVQNDLTVSAGSVAELIAHPETALVGVIASHLKLPPVEIALASESPRGGGLGGSSALAVALLVAAEEELGRPRSSPRALANIARDLEARLMGLPTGAQDHYPALLGGVLEVVQQPGGEAVRHLSTDLMALGRSLLVVYSGQSHFSAGSNWQVVRRRLENDAEVVALLEGIARVASEIALAVEGGDLPRTGELMSREWSYRRQLAEGISTPFLEEILRRSVELGAWGGKVCGAGGGGSLAILCPPDSKAAIASALQEIGAQVLSAHPTAEPLALEHL
jgi:D-glycero-alpha-D-manno-heptose-7-phosphate kinase